MSLAKRPLCLARSKRTPELAWDPPSPLPTPIRPPRSSAWQGSSSLFTAACPHSAEEKTEVQMGEGTCLGSRSDSTAKPTLGLVPRAASLSSHVGPDSFTPQTLSTALCQDLPRGARGLGETSPRPFQYQGEPWQPQHGPGRCSQKRARRARKGGNTGGECGEFGQERHGPGSQEPQLLVSWVEANVES